MKKINKKKFFIIIILFITIICGSVFAWFKYNEYIKEKNYKILVSDIKKSYNKYVKTIKNTDIYTKKMKNIGYISKNIELVIEKDSREDFSYYKIKDTDYYIYYKNIKKIKEIKQNDIYDNYVTLNKNIITNKKTKIYLDDNRFIKLNEKISIPIRFINNDIYYVKYLDRIFFLKKYENMEIIDNEIKEEEASYISIINYNKIKESCSDEFCVPTNKIEEQLTYLKDNGYYSINIDEYKNWLAGNIRLKPKAVLLMSQDEDENIKLINEKYNNIINIVGSDLKFVDSNTKTTRENKLDNLPRYNMKNNTSMDDFKKMVLGEKVVEQKVNSSSEQGIAVINYHFFYDETSEACNEDLCLDIKNFKAQLNYLRDNNYKTLTMDEYRKWMYGEIDLPSKSVLLTIDDGAMGTGSHNGNKLIPILEEYKMYATLFLITGWWDINNYRSKYLDVESHTYNMHNRGDCGDAQMICYDYNRLVDDLKKSLQITESNKAFCFPFYKYDEEAINAVRDVGFQLSFIGGNRKSKRSDNKFKIPRYPIYKRTSIQTFINMVS